MNAHMIRKKLQGGLYNFHISAIFSYICIKPVKKNIRL